MQQETKQPSAYPLGDHADGCVLHQSFHLIFESSSSRVSFSRLQSDFPYTWVQKAVLFGYESILVFLALALPLN